MNNNNLFSKIFAWLAVGLLISFGVGYYISTDIILTVKILDKYLIFAIVELAFAFGLGFFIRKLSKSMTIILYILYCITTGLTFSSIFIAYQLSSIMLIFLVTSIIFALLAIYGYVTKKDITKIGTLLLFGLLGIIILSVVNLFIKSSSFDLLLTIISIVIFMGFIIYDIHIIKRKLYDIEEDKLAVYGAFQLYLDFINLFLDLLKLFGKSKD